MPPTRDLAGGEGMPRNHRRRLAQYDRDFLRDDFAAVERAKFGELPRRRRAADAMAEIVLTARVQLHVSR